MQDLSDAGKLASDGWLFINSFNTERAWGGTLEGNPPLESGASQNDMDYMHIINWRAEEVVAKAGQDREIAGFAGDPARDRRSPRACCTSWASPRARTAST